MHIDSSWVLLLSQDERARIVLYDQGEHEIVDDHPPAYQVRKMALVELPFPLDMKGLPGVRWFGWRCELAGQRARIHAQSLARRFQGGFFCAPNGRYHHISDPIRRALDLRLFLHGEEIGREPGRTGFDTFNIGP